MAELTLEERLANFGDVLSDELTTWPSFNPAAVAAASTPLLLLRRWRGRWLGAGHRPLFALAAIAALTAGVVIAITLLGLDRGASGDSSSAAVEVAEVSSAASPAPPIVDDAADGEERDDGENDLDSPPEPVTATGATEPATGTTEQAGDTEVPTPSTRCRDGLLVNGRCRIATEPSPADWSDACAEQGGIADNAGCFRIADAAVSCPAGFETVATDCLLRSAPTDNGLTCPEGADLEGASCLQRVPPVTACADGVLSEGMCRVERAPATGGELSCVGGGPVIDGSCTVTVAADCGTATLAAGGCTRPAPLEKRETCPVDHSLSAGWCVPANGCPPSKTYFQQGVPGACGSPSVTQLVCSATGQPLAGGSCVTTSAPTCPSGHQLQGSSCSMEYAATHSAYQCPAGQLVIGSSCFDERPAESTCVDGLMVDTDCLITTPAVGAGLSCPTGFTLAAARSCTRTMPADLVCVEGDLVETNCRIAIPLDDLDICESGAQLDHGWCVRFEEPIAS